MKTRELVERYVALCEAAQPKRIVELGINRGGSTAMLSELARPERLVAVELAAEAAPLLAAYIAEHELGDVVRPYYGVDQADRARLIEIMDDELGDAAIDLVVDDASHLYEPSRASFEVLFPRLRPGGIYVLEDWSWQHRYADRMVKTPRPTPPREQAAARGPGGASRRGERRSLQARGSTDPARERAGPRSDATVGRGPGSDRRQALGGDPARIGIARPVSFRLADLYHDHFGLLGPG